MRQGRGTAQTQGTRMATKQKDSRTTGTSRAPRRADGRTEPPRGEIRPPRSQNTTYQTHPSEKRQPPPQENRHGNARPHVGRKNRERPLARLQEAQAPPPRRGRRTRTHPFSDEQKTWESSVPYPATNIKQPAPRRSPPGAGASKRHGHRPFPFLLWHRAAAIDRTVSVKDRRVSSIWQT